MLTFISGGARSGKSRWAEEYAKRMHPHKRPLIYLATAEQSDSEMADRITRHRKGRGTEWQTIECPIDVTAALETLHEKDTLLLDCLTIWVSHMMYKQNVERSCILGKVMEWFELIEEKQLTMVIVSNDVNEGVPTDNVFLKDYMCTLESVHRLITEKAERVVQVIAGIPIDWKGRDEL